MADEEAAFFAAQQAAHEAEGNYEAPGADAASEKPAESNLFDEYDPAQAVSPVPTTVQSPSNAQESSVHQTPSSALLNDIMNSTSTVPLSSNALSTVPDQSTADGPDQSRSMSRATSSDEGQNVTTEQTSTSLPSTQPDITKDLTHGDTPSLKAEPSTDFTNGVDDFAAAPAAHQGLAGDMSMSAIGSDEAQAAVDKVALSKDSAPDTNGRKAETVPSSSSNVIAEPSARRQSVNTSTSLPKARLPHDTIGILEDRIKEDPRGDMDAWLSLIGEHRKRGKLDEARSVYERFFIVFPAAAEQWVAYAQMENEAGNRNGMERVFQRTLLQIPYLPLWSLYLDHIRRLNNLATDTSGNARQTISQAYELATQQVGLDKDSGKLWQDYIQFIRSGPGNIGGSGWQDQQKMDVLRKVYQHAICVPTQATNLLWKEYDGFERGLNKMTGQKFLQDQSPAYMSARSSYTALQNITRSLRQTTLPVLPPTLGFSGDVEYIEQLDIWRRWIQWEKEDPLVLKQEDISGYRARIIFVYKQALMALRFWPELWCDASEFCFSNEMESEGREFLFAGIAANPESVLLAFKRADRLELTSANEEGDEAAKRRGASVREPYDKVLDALYELLTKSKVHEEHDLARVEASYTANDVHQQLNGVKTVEDEEDAIEDDEASSKDKQKTAQINSIKTSYAAQVRLLSRTLSHVWIACMRAMRRIQGKAAFRATFGDARKRGRLTSEVYIAVALIEFHCYEPDTARKIFDRGLKLFQEDEGFALAYIKHLVANNDHTNARVTFETAVTRLEKKPENVAKAKSLYLYFHDFESRYGELAQIVKLEKRMSDLFLDDPSLSLFSRRFTDQSFDPTAIRPVVSLSQSRPKIIPSIETISPDEVIAQATQATSNVVSPKRPLPLDDSDNDAGRPQKFQRGASPLKGAAGRRLDQQKRSQLPIDPPVFQHQVPPQSLPIPPLPRDVMFLLSIIPKADTYSATRFNPAKLVQLIRQTDVPNHIAQLPNHGPGGRGIPVAPPQLQHHIAQPPVQHTPPVVQQRPPMPAMPAGPPMQYGQYNGGFNGGYSNISFQYRPLASAQYQKPLGQPSGPPPGYPVRNADVVAADSRDQNWQRGFLDQRQSALNEPAADSAEDRINRLVRELFERGYW